ncbi:hypothetical protein JCM10213_003829 [Rhodosporidiobolus nylandii]
MGWSGNVNPSTANIALSPQGSEFLWTWFTLFTASALIIAFVAHNRPSGRRAFHYIALAILLITALVYFLLASNLAWTPIAVEWVRSGSRGANQIARGAPNPPTRAIGYGRHIGWVLCWPMLVLLLALVTGFSLSRVFVTMFFAMFMAVCLLIGALIRTRYKWPLFAFACACLFYLWWSLLLPGRSTAFKLGDEFGRSFIRSTSILAFLWLVYPIIWACAEGSNLITVTSESIAYGVLDLLLYIGFIFFFLFSAEALDYDRLGFSSGKWSTGASYPYSGHQGAPQAGYAAAPQTGMASTSTPAGAAHPAQPAPAPSQAAGVPAHPPQEVPKAAPAPAHPTHEPSPLGVTA